MKALLPVSWLEGGNVEEAGHGGDEVPVAEHDPLGFARRTGRVHDDGRVVGGGAVVSEGTAIGKKKRLHNPSFC